ncbi:MAG: outer membrane protein OmpW [Alteromonadaceae bacterium]|nr:MAG: outer membrane protein OmpW [Alteromonadaceae bacterium]
MKRVIASAVAIASLGLITDAIAYEPGDLVIRAGLTKVSPDESSGNVIVNDLGGNTGMQVSVDDSTQLGLNFVYFINQHLAIELLAATPFNHSINLENSALGLGDGSLAETDQLPPTLSALYYFSASDSVFQPYVGLGINYTIFFDESFDDTRQAQGFNSLELDDSIGLSAQLGFDYTLNDNWLLNTSLRYIDISTTAKFKVGNSAAKVDVDIDPWVYTLAIGYKF